MLRRRMRARPGPAPSSSASLRWLRRWSKANRSATNLVATPTATEVERAATERSSPFLFSDTSGFGTEIFGGESGTRITQKLRITTGTALAEGRTLFEVRCKYTA